MLAQEAHCIFLLRGQMQPFHMVAPCMVPTLQAAWADAALLLSSGVEKPFSYVNSLYQRCHVNAGRIHDDR